MAKWRSKLENIRTGQIRNVEGETKQEVIEKENTIKDSASQNLPPLKSGDAQAWKTVERQIVDTDTESKS